MNTTPAAIISLVRELVTKFCLGLWLTAAAILALSPLTVSTASSLPPWYDISWSYRRPVTVTNTYGLLNDYQVQITLGATFDFGSAQPDGSDLFLTADDGVTPVPFWIENWDALGTTATVWAKVASLPFGDSDVYMYYGNPTATPAGDGDAVFELFDHFEVPLDPVKWSSGGTPTVAGSMVTIDNINEFIRSVVEFQHVALRSRARFSAYADYGYIGFNSGVLSVGTNDATFMCFGSGTVRSITSSSTGWTWGYTASEGTDWKTWEVLWRPGEADFFVDGTLRIAHTTNVPSVPLTVQYNTYSGSPVIDVDWTLVRSHVLPEPTTSVGSEELPSCAVTPASIDFGVVLLGNSKDRTFTIINVGGDLLNGNITEPCDQFSIESGSGAYSLVSGDSLVVTVRFSPTLSGADTCVVETGTEPCSDVVCTGIGLCPPGARLYVDTDADGVGDGSSWADACTELRDALATATLCPSVDTIWVAESTYKPAADTNRTATFQLRNYLAIYGGFAGTETLLSERDWVTHVTTLSGDIGVVADSTDNSYHVVTASGTDSTAVLDGFRITDGYAYGAGDDERGGGLYNQSGDPTLCNLIVSGNDAEYAGGGMYNNQGSPKLTNVVFEDNSGTHGGGMVVQWVGSNDTELNDVVFTGNSSNNGGGLLCNGADPTLINVMFIENYSTGAGGGMRCSNGANPTIINGVFCRNATASSGWGGGFLNSQEGAPVLTNVSFYGNVSGQGGGIWADTGSPVLTNVIMWDDSASTSGDEILNLSGASTVIAYSLIEGCGGSGGGWDSSVGTDGGGNVDGDPLFTDASNCDLRLLGGSPAIDAGDTEAVPLNLYDLAGNARIQNGAVDMGAYEDPVVTAIKDPHDDVPPASFALHQNYPNPFNPTTTIAYDVPAGGGHVTLRVYDVQGKLVQTLVNGTQSGGEKRAAWDAKDDRGSSVASGIYFYRMTAPGFVETRKMVLLR